MNETIVYIGTINARTVGVSAIGNCPNLIDQRVSEARRLNPFDQELCPALQGVDPAYVEVRSIKQVGPEALRPYPGSEAASKVFTAEGESPVAPDTITRLLFLCVSQTTKKAQTIGDVVRAVCEEGEALSIDVWHGKFRA